MVSVFLSVRPSDSTVLPHAPTHPITHTHTQTHTHTHTHTPVRPESGLWWGCRACWWCRFPCPSDPATQLSGPAGTVAARCPCPTGCCGECAHSFRQSPLAHPGECNRATVRWLLKCLFFQTDAHVCSEMWVEHAHHELTDYLHHADMHRYTDTYSHTLSHAQCTHGLTHIPAYTQTHDHSYTHTHPLTHTLSISLPKTHTHTQTRYLSQTHTQLTLSFSHTQHTLFLRHTHSFSDIRTHIYIHSQMHNAHMD